MSNGLSFIISLTAFTEHFLCVKQSAQAGEKDRDEAFPLSKQRLSVDCGQINETTNISIDSEDK